MLLRINKNPSRNELRQLAWSLLIGFGVLGVIALWRHRPTLAYRLWGTGGILGTASLVSTQTSRIIYRLWMGWAVVMGTVMTQIILACLFFVVITPIAILFRCFGRDPLRLKKSSIDESYWTDHPKITDRSYYQRLF